MAVTATNTLQATIVSADGNGIISINRGLGNPALQGVFGQMTVNELLALGANPINMTFGSNIFNLYVKNNASGGGGTITVQLNLNGGGLVTVAVLQPGGAILIWNIVNNIAGSGYSGMTLTASIANTPAEYFLGA